MNKTIKIIGIVSAGAVGLIAATYGGLVALHVLRERRSADSTVTNLGLLEDWVSVANGATPSDNEARLLNLAGKFGWPADPADVGIGTRDGAPFLIYQINGRTVQLQFMDPDTCTSFEIVNNTGVGALSPLAGANPSYDTVCRELSGN